MPILDEPIPYPQEVELFDAQASRSHFRVVTLGDSITQCVRQEKGHRWPDLLNQTLGDDCRVVNAGIGGTSSNLGLFRWRRDVSPVQPHAVIICFLLNDSHIRFYECRSSYVVQCSPDRMDANLRAMADLCRAVGAAPVFWTPPPVPNWVDSFKSRTHFDIQMSLLEQYLRVVERVASEMEIPLANLWRTFSDQVDGYPDAFFNRPDGYHSNDASQPVLARNIAACVEPLVAAWRAGRTG
jgi:lysophospholipase L1-like esterase